MSSLELSRRLYPTKEQFISAENLKETERHLRNLIYSQPIKASLVKTWVEQRKMSIEAIGRLEKKLENLHRACNAANGVGAALEIVGGLAMVAGAILTACGHKNVGEFLTKKVSPATGVTGMATTMTSSVAEMGLTHSTMKEVQIVLQKDEECTKILEDNLQHSRTIDSCLKRIFNCSILSDNFLDVVQLVRECISLVEVGHVSYSKLKDQVIRRALKGTNVTELTETTLQNVCTTIKIISTGPDLRKSVRSICDIIQGSPLAVESIKIGLRISYQICDVLKVDVFTSLLGFGILKTSAGVMATKCLLGTVLIAVNVLSVISAVKDAQEGSSKYSKMLKDLNLALAMELTTVRNKYPELL